MTHGKYYAPGQGYFCEDKEEVKFNMKNIIAATDFSDNATNAVRYAAALAEATQARLVLFHAFPYPVIATDIPVEIQSFIDETTETHVDKLLKIRHTLEKQFNIEVSCIAEGGSLAYNLEDVMKREKGDLAVMGLRGSNRAINVLMGSTTFEVMRLGKVPMLIVPNNTTYHKPERILFACDNPFITKGAVLQPLKDLARQFDTEIEVYMVNASVTASASGEPPHSNLEEHFENLRHSYTFDEAEGVRQSILQRIQAGNADIVTMIPHHRSIWTYLFDKSDTHSIALQATIPMLVLAENTAP